MDTIFHNAGKTLQNGYLVTANFQNGAFGTMEVRKFVSLELDEQKDERVHFKVSGGLYYACGQEPRDYDQNDRARQPYDRMNQATYIPHRFDSLDILPTSDGSRFLSLKTVWKESTSFASADNWPNREVAVILDTKAEFVQYLDEILIKMGIPAQDLIKIKKDILSKID